MSYDMPENHHQGRPLPDTEPTISTFDLTDLDKEKIELSLQRLQGYIHYVCNEKWWHDEEGNPIERNRAELIALMHSELSEGLEGERKSLSDTHLPHRPMIEVELADTIIRILDYAGGFGYDVAGALFEKLTFNAVRKDHTHEERKKEHGKKF